MKKTELIMLKRQLQQEIARRNRINELLSNNLIQELLLLNNLHISKLPVDDQWLILEELLTKFKITESHGILVCTGNYIVDCQIYYQETNYYEQQVPFDTHDIEYQMFKDIETNKTMIAYSDRYIQGLIAEENNYSTKITMTPSQFCHTRYGRHLTSELQEKYLILNPYNSSANENGFHEVQKDFFTTAIAKGQFHAKQLVLTKYPHMK